MKLHLFDFDGTLFKSPEYVPDWWEAPGQWSWLSHPLSLTDPCVPLNPSSNWWIKNTVEEAKKSVRNRDALTIICTGRVETHKPRILSLLNKAGIRGLDNLYINPGISAAKFKLKVIDDLYRKYSFEEVHIWENENYNHYKEVIESKYGIPCVIHPIHEEHGHYQCTPQDIRLDGQDINIRNENEVLPPNALRVASTRERMAIRVASLKVAQMEKEAFINAKRIMTKIMSYLPNDIQALLQGANEEQITKQIKRLQKDKEFMKIVEEAPKKSSIRELWGYFSFSIKRVFNFGKKALGVAIFLGVLLAMLGGMAYFLGGGEIGALIAGFLFAPAIDFEYDSDPKSIRKRQESNAREIAKNRLLNDREYKR